VGDENGLDSFSDSHPGTFSFLTGCLSQIELREKRKRVFRTRVAKFLQIILEAPRSKLTKLTQ
jgi:hypothetical protein